MKKKAVFNWSGGKDSALALYKVLQEGEYEVVALLTTINGETVASSMHQIPLHFIQIQADSIGIPLYPIMLHTEGMGGYESAMRKTVEHFKEQGVTHFIFGDIFLHNVRAYREQQLAPYNIEVVEPLWDKTSEEVIEEFLESGIKTKIIITQADKLDAKFVGCDLDREYVNSLPEKIDICGENGEYHTFAYGGPLFKEEIKFELIKPIKLSYDIKLDNGSIRTFSYWHTAIR